MLKRTKEKPVLVLAQDNSESLLKNRDSLYYNGEYRESLEKIAAKLGEQFEVVRLTFGNRVQRNGKIDFSEKRTDIAAVTDYVRQNFISRPPQAMVLLTDGIYNAGINPRYRLPSFPVYTVALGDTIVIRMFLSGHWKPINSILWELFSGKSGDWGVKTKRKAAQMYLKRKWESDS